MRGFVLGVLVALSVGVLGWAADDACPNCPPGTVSARITHAGGAVTKATTSDEIVDDAFSNTAISIVVGDTVTWVNHGGQPHTSTSDVGSAEVWDSGSIPPGTGSFSHTFNAVGTFHYHCTIHPFMTGTITVSSNAPVITSSATASAQVGVGFTYQIVATHSPTSYGATSLPFGLSVNATSGAITGTPTSAGSATVALSATNGSGTGNASLVITVVPPAPVISSAGTASGQVGVAFSYQITASNVPTSFSAAGLPPGVSVNLLSGLISGTPTAAGSYPATIHAGNAGGSGNASLAITVLPAAPVITSATTATATAGTAFSYQIAASNAPTSFAAGNLPAGLAVDASGLISGTPTGATVAAVAISAGNTGGTGSATLTLTVNPPPPVITSAVTVGGTVGSAFTYQIAATNAPTSYGADGLPGGLAVNATSGAITGIPTASGSATVALSATNAGGAGTATLAITIVGSPNAPAITSAGSATVTVGQAFGYQIAATHGPTSFGASGLPAGFTVDASGLVSGVPSVVGTVTATVTATNGFGTGTASLILIVVPPPPVVTSATAATVTVGTAFSYQITASNAPTSFGASPLPAGLTVATGTGLISGTPTALGATVVTVSAGNGGGSGTAAVTVTVVPPAPVITSALVASTVGSVISYRITATNNPTSFAASGLPAGFSVDAASGVISGSSVAAGTYTVTVSATNAGGTGSASVTVTVSAGTSTAGTSTSGAGTAGTAGAGTTTVTTTAAGGGGGGGGGGCGIGAGLTGLLAALALRFRRRRA